MSPIMTNQTLKELDPKIHEIIRRETERQQRKIIMIASESITPKAVRDTMACEFAHIYAEGYPSPRTLFEPAECLSSFEYQLTQYRRYSNRRYYKGCEYVDILESTVRRRTAEVFANDRVKPEEIFTNAQPLSGAAANNAVYNAFVKPGECVLGPSLTHGGHLTHGSEVNRSGMSHRIVPYMVGRSGRLDYDAIEKLAKENRPKLMIGGFSAYPWDVDWARMAEIANQVGAILLADISHLAGMVAAGLLNNPVGHAHVVSFTTHKTLCGPRGAMLLTTDPEIARRIDLGVFPGEQGGPHIQQMAAKAVAMNIAASDAFRKMQKQVLDNCQALCKALQSEGFELAYGGSNTHMCLIDLRKVTSPNGLPVTGEIASRILDMSGIVCNKNTIFGDTNAVHPSGVRFGATWVTQRGLTEKHMNTIAKLVAKVITNIHPFSYIGGASDWHRGKIDPKVIEQIIGEVAGLLDEADRVAPLEEVPGGYPHYTSKSQKDVRVSPLAEVFAGQQIKTIQKGSFETPASFGDVDQERTALQDGAALSDGSSSLLLELHHGRAGQLLEGACTCEIMSMEVGRCVDTLFLDADGTPTAEGVIYRLGKDRDGFDRFMARVFTDQPDAFLRWLRGLSDGYLLQDKDLYLKSEGPCVIDDLSEPAGARQPMSCLEIRGPKARDTLKSGLPGNPPESQSVSFQDGLWAASRLEEGQTVYELFVPNREIGSVWSKLIEAGAQPVGWEVLAGASKDKGKKSDKVKTEDPRIAISKTFFVGQKALLAGAKPTETPPEFAWKPEEAPLKETCLIAEHQKLASPKHLVPFAGWRMPVMYTSILDEHEAVRNAAGLFDVSHMGLLEFSGPYAERFLDLVTTNYVPMLVPGQAHYSYLLGHDGRCIDDIIVYRLEPERFFMVVNAANADEDIAWLKGILEQNVLIDPNNPAARIRGQVQMKDLKDPKWGDACRVDLALQGPASLKILSGLTKQAHFATALRNLRKFELVSGELAGLPVTVARTGYTGEQMGFEIFVNPAKAPKLWSAICEEGKDLGCVPAGLGARDSLRTEAGYPLHGHELSGPHNINPIESGYGGYIKLHKPFFPGRSQCVQLHERRERTVVRFEVNEKGGKVLRLGNPVLAGRKGEYAGVVTSCASTKDRQVGMAIVDTKFAKVGAQLNVLPITEQEKSPPARAPKDLHSGDWMVIPRTATVLSRLMQENEKPLS